MRDFADSYGTGTKYQGEGPEKGDLVPNPRRPGAVSGKKRDDLQSVISGLREEDFGIPLQFENFRD